MKIDKIYKITNKINGKIYIGKTNKPIEKRLREHIRSAYKNTNNHKFYNAIRKYGEENFEIELIEEVINESWQDKEIYWINFYDSVNKGYNTAPGGEGGGGLFGEANPSKRLEVRQKISKTLTGRKIGPIPEERRQKLVENWTEEKKQQKSKEIKDLYSDKENDYYKSWLKSCQDFMNSLTKEEKIEKFGHPGDQNGRAKIFEIYNEKDELQYICEGNFRKICEENGLPFIKLWETSKTGKKLYEGLSEKRLQNLKEENKKYIGWYAIDLGRINPS